MRKLIQAGIILSAVLTAAVIYGETNARVLNDTQAEDIYSQAVNVAGEGAYDDSLNLLKTLINSNYTNQYIYYALLSVYSEKVKNSQILPGSDTNSIKATLKEAIQYTAGALKIYPHDKKILYRYVEFNRQIGDIGEFYNALQRVIGTDSTDIYANYYLGEYYFINKDMDKAIPYFQTVVNSPRGSADFELMAVYGSYYKLGLIAASKFNYPAAIKYMEQAKDIYSKDFELIKYLALTYAEKLNFEKAVENFSIIPLAYQNEDTAAVYAAILFIQKSKKLDGVIQEYKNESEFIQAIDDFRNKDYTNSMKHLDAYILKNKFADYYTHYFLYLNYEAVGEKVKAVQQAFLLGNQAKQVGEYEIAIGFYQKLEKEQKAIPEIYWLIGSLYDDEENYSNAVSYYEKYVRHPDNQEYKIPALVRLSYMYYKLGDKEKSAENIVEAKKSAKSREELFQVYFYSGLMRFEVRNYKDALPDLEEALKSSKEDARIYYFIATANFEISNRQKAIDYLNQGRNFDKNNAEINNLLAYIYSIEEKNLDEALNLVNLALTAQPENIAYLDTLGWIFYQRKEYDKSVEVFGRILTIMQDDSKRFSGEGMDEIYYHLGMVFEKLGNKDDARRYYEEGLRRNPDNSEIKKHLK